jgi:hypothetical protein
MIAAAVEIPAYALVLLVLNRFGRKIPLCTFMLVAGVALIVTIFVEKEQVLSSAIFYFSYALLKIMAKLLS